jgi:hypothetical protein
MPVFLHKANAMLLTLKISPISDLTVPAKLQAYLASDKFILGAINEEAKSIINDYNVGMASESGDFKSLSENAVILKNLTEEQRVVMENNSRTLNYAQYSKNLLLDKLEQLFKSNSNIE